MNTNELIRRVDESAEMGKRILKAHESKQAGGAMTSGSMRAFCRGIKFLIEDVYGEDNHLSHRFPVMDESDPEKVAEGLALLKELRRVITYSGEFSS